LSKLDGERLVDDAAWRAMGTIRTFLLESLCRVVNTAISVVALVLSAPILLVLAAMIRFDSPGPAIFRQKRLGRDRRTRKDRREEVIRTPIDKRNGDRRIHDLGGRPFTFYKFRTMRWDARELYPKLYEYKYSDEETENICFKVKNDPRLTRVGTWLRKTSLDELPNFINVIKGDMNLVGPRPDIPEMVRYYTPFQKKYKLSVKPGITGYAQIRGRGELSFQNTLKQDISYVRERSIRTDLKTLIETLAAVFGRTGAF